MKILLIEDDFEIRRLLARGLTGKGHEVETVTEAMEGIRAIVANQPDVVILDLGLPDLDGTDLLRMIRTVSQVPVIVATARDDDQVAVSLLNSGADDYVIKPYTVENIEARAKAVMRRLAPTSGSVTVITIGDLIINVNTREASLGGDRLDLTPKEFDLLRLLAERREEVVSKREMFAEVWREPYGASDRTVDVHLSWLRKKLGESAKEPRYLRTVHGVGVKLVDPGR